MKSKSIIADLFMRVYSIQKSFPIFVGDNLNIKGILALFRQSRAAILITTILGMSLTYCLSFLLTPLYTSQSSVYAISQESGGNILGGLGAVASALGYGMPSNSGQSLDLADLLKSRHILEKLASSNVVQDTTISGPKSLTEFWYPSNEMTDAEKAEKTLHRLRSYIKIHSFMESNLIRIELSADNPPMAQLLNTHLYNFANTYYLDTRTEELVAKLTFLETSTVEMQDKLQNTEDKLTEFLTRNSRYNQSPILQQEYSRLVRNVGLNQKVVLELEGQILSLRMELSGQSPSVRVLNQPTLALKPSSPERFKLAILAMFALLGLNFAAILAANYSRMEATHNQDVQ